MFLIKYINLGNQFHYKKSITRNLIMLNTMMECENTSFANILIPFLRSCSQHMMSPRTWFFCWNPYKIEVAITCLIEMLQLQSIGHMPHLQYNLNHVIKFCWWRHRHILWRHNLQFQNYFILRRPRVSSFADIIKIAAIFV